MNYSLGTISVFWPICFYMVAALLCDFIKVAIVIVNNAKFYNP